MDVTSSLSAADMFSEWVPLVAKSSSMAEVTNNRRVFYLFTKVPWGVPIKNRE